jgi:colanic acid/amylovoran biosynthesis glycosyltransferase
MPVVSTTHCDIPQVVEDGLTGLLAPEDDQEALNGCLWAMLDDPDCWPAMGAAAGRLARERFDMRRCAAQLTDRYRRLLAGDQAE